MARWALGLVRDFQFLTAEDGVAGQTVERFDLLVAGTAAEVFHGDTP